MTQTLTNDQLSHIKATALNGYENAHIVLALIATLEAAQAENAKLREVLNKIECEIDDPARFNDRVQKIIDAALIKETP
jgi:cell division protein FtsB